LLAGTGALSWLDLPGDIRVTTDTGAGEQSEIHAARDEL
jgi:hypothetical protein